MKCFIIILFCIFSSSCWIRASDSNVTISARFRFVDMEGNPVAGYPIQAYGIKKLITEEITAHGFSDESGYFAFTLPGIQYGQVRTDDRWNNKNVDLPNHLVAGKGGKLFYSANIDGPYLYTTKGFRPRVPAPEYHLLAREVRDPVPMIAYEGRWTQSNASSEALFDLMIGDWVAPLGIGKHGDVAISATVARVGRAEVLADGIIIPEKAQKSTEFLKRIAKIRFVRPGEGMYRAATVALSPFVSRFVAPYQAATSGYMRVITYKDYYAWGSGLVYSDLFPLCYQTDVFRIRTKAQLPSCVRLTAVLCQNNVGRK